MHTHALSIETQTLSAKIKINVIKILYKSLNDQ